MYNKHLAIIIKVCYKGIEQFLQFFFKSEFLFFWKLAIEVSTIVTSKPRNTRWPQSIPGTPQENVKYLHISELYTFIYLLVGGHNLDLYSWNDFTLSVPFRNQPKFVNYRSVKKCSRGSSKRISFWGKQHYFEITVTDYVIIYVSNYSWLVILVVHKSNNSKKYDWMTQLVLW